MSRTTLQNTLAELFALLADSNGNPVASLASAGCVKVYPHEPGATGIAKPCSVTLDPIGIEPTDWTIAVRVYVSGDLPPDKHQDLKVDVPVVVSDLLAAGQGYGPDRWQITWVDQIECSVVISEVMVGREDGF